MLLDDSKTKHFIDIETMYFQLFNELKPYKYYNNTTWKIIRKGFKMSFSQHIVLLIYYCVYKTTGVKPVSFMV